MDSENGKCQMNSTERKSKTSLFAVAFVVCAGYILIAGIVLYLEHHPRVYTPILNSHYEFVMYSLVTAVMIAIPLGFIGFVQLIVSPFTTPPSLKYKGWLLIVAGILFMLPPVLWVLYRFFIFATMG